ncbi:enoyl-CoA hydratase/isomerase family protein [Alphaproteobacteria bacterium]|nr:enoyl-CoA hydratase/isomerase family protein [Alphaproteobacteria bacterium]
MSIKYSENGNTAIITLNRPNNLNALNYEMIISIEECLKNINKNKNIKLIIFKGEGDRAFCAGGDVKSFYEEKLTNINKLRKIFFYREYKLNYLIKKYKKPIISFVNGICMGGGVGIAMHSSIVIVSENVKFAMPECTIGLFPDVGSSNFLSKLKSNIGLYIALTGKRLVSGDLIELGLANYCVSRNNFKSLEKRLINIKNMRSVHKIIDEYSEKTNSSIFPSLNKNINNIFKYNKVEKIISLLESSKEIWAEEAFKAMNKSSPTSLKISLKQLRLSKYKSFKDNLIMDYRLSQSCMTGVDFYEGVRSVLVDKDFKPIWSPNKVQDVSNKLVVSHFKSLGKGDLAI